MNNLKKIGIQFTLFITVICCFGIIICCVTHDSLELTELTEHHATHGNSFSAENHCHLHFDDIIHVMYVTDLNKSVGAAHPHSTQMSIPSQLSVSVWQPPKPL